MNERWNMVVTITKESVNSIVQSVDCTYLWVGMYLSNGDVATMAYGWMKKNSASGPLMDIIYFHMDVHEKSHHELNGCLKEMII